MTYPARSLRPYAALAAAAQAAALSGCLLASGVRAQAPAQAPAPVNAIWAGQWRPVDTNLAPPPRPRGAAAPAVTPDLVLQRNAASLQVNLVRDGAAPCPLRYDGLVPAHDIVRRIEERAQWQFKAENWPAGTDPAQFVGLRREFDEALRIARSLPADSYRRVRATCPAAKPPAGAASPSAAGPTDDRFFVLNEGRRLFEFSFPDNGLSLRVGLYERVH